MGLAVHVGGGSGSRGRDTRNDRGANRERDDRRGGGGSTAGRDDRARDSGRGGGGGDRGRRCRRRRAMHRGVAAIAVVVIVGRQGLGVCDATVRRFVRV